uniref:Uncharacterized protein n=1 Tax=Rhizophora mucronata TaxID=61149 RepID=A0A2P2N722_RHIMU
MHILLSFSNTDCAHVMCIYQAS